MPEWPQISEIQYHEAAIEAIGTPQFPDALSALIRHYSPYDRLFSIAIFPAEPPLFLSSNLPERPDAASMAHYLDASFLLDPFYQLYLSGTNEGVFKLLDCVPDDFFAGDYYQHFYQKIGLIDECAIMVPSVNGACIFLSTGYIDSERLPRGDDRSGLRAIYPVLKALCRQHWPAPTRNDANAEGPVRAHLNTAFQNFGSTVLTPREHQVVHLILRGHSSKSLSENLGISLQTVKNHRKSIHAKLDITTQGELFSIFLNAVTASPVGCVNDPLENYMRAS